MAKWYELTAKVVSQKGHCVAGHKVSDEFTVGNTVSAGMYPCAFFTHIPIALALQAGGAFPWEKDADKTTVACPDAENPVVFELRRIRK